MEDIGIKPKQFEEACGKGSKRSFQHGLFEQVWYCLPIQIMRVSNSGLGSRWFWDIQENDDSEEYWITASGSGVASAEVWSTSRISSTYYKEKHWQWKSSFGGNQKVVQKIFGFRTNPENGKSTLEFVKLSSLKILGDNNKYIQTSSHHQEIQEKPIS